MRIAFAGFRHPHIFALYDLCRDAPGVEIVGCAEDDPVARETARRQRGVSFTHRSVEALLSGGAFDAIAVGDYFAEFLDAATAEDDGRRRAYNRRIVLSQRNSLELEAVTAR